jgi:hypothetical protein
MHHNYIHIFSGSGWTLGSAELHDLQLGRAGSLVQSCQKVTVVDDDAPEVLPGLFPPRAGPYYAYDLGPAIPLPNPLKNGTIYATARVSVMIASSSYCFRPEAGFGNLTGTASCSWGNA